MKFCNNHKMKLFQVYFSYIIFQYLRGGGTSCCEANSENYCDCFNISAACTLTLSSIKISIENKCYQITNNIFDDDRKIDSLDEYISNSICLHPESSLSINASIVNGDDNLSNCSSNGIPELNPCNSNDTCVEVLDIYMMFNLTGNETSAYKSKSFFRLLFTIKINHTLPVASTPSITTVNSPVTTESAEQTENDTSMSLFQSTTNNIETTTKTTSAKTKTGTTATVISPNFSEASKKVGNIAKKDTITEAEAEEAAKIVGNLLKNVPVDSSSSTMENSEAKEKANEVAKNLPNIFRRIILPNNNKTKKIDEETLVVQISLVKPSSSFSYIPKGENQGGIEIPSQILKFFSASEGEKKEITVLIIDYSNDVLFPSNENVKNIFSIDIGRNGSENRNKLPVPLQISFPRSVLGNDFNNFSNSLQEQKPNANLTCVFWDFEAKSWLSDGCSLNNRTSLTCECTHLTNFALIVRPNLPSDVVLDVVSKIGFVLSIVGLIATLVIHIIFKELRKRRPSIILMHICFNLCVGYVIFLVGVEHAKWNTNLCIATAFFLHVFFLAAWGWMTVYSYDVYVSIVKVFDNTRRHFLRKYGGAAYATAVIVPVLTVVVGLNVHSSGKPTYLAANVCWLSTFPLLLGFFLPICVMLCFNQTVFIMVFRELFGKSKEVTSSALKRSLEQQFIISVTMVCFTGLAWIFAFILLVSELFNSQGYETLFSWLFVIFNTLQGFGIFILTVVKRKETRKVWWGPIQSKLSSVFTNINISMLSNESTSTAKTLKATHKYSTDQMSDDMYDDSL